jgi:hypothetical protein
MSSRSPANGAKGTRPSPSGQKRAVDEISDDDSPPKRRRVSETKVDEIEDDDDITPLFKPSPKPRPTTLVNNTNGLSKKPIIAQQTSARPPFTSANNHLNQPLQPNRPYSPKHIPTKALPTKEKPLAAPNFWAKLDPSKPTTPIHSQQYEPVQNVNKLIQNQRKHQVRPSVGTAAAKEDPFVEGYTHRRFGGIKPQGYIGATPSFSPISPKSKMDQKRAGMGIKVVGRRKDAMRS